MPLKRHRPNTTLKTRLSIGFGVLISLATLAGAVGLFFMQQINRRVERIYIEEVQPLEALDDTKSATYRIRGDALEHILAARPASETRLSGEIAGQERRVYERLRQFRQTQLEPPERRLLASFDRSFSVYMRRVRNEILPLSAADRKGEAEEVARGVAVEEFRRTREAVNALMDYSLRRAKQRADNAARDYRAAVLTVLSLVGALTLIGIILAVRLTRTFVGPLKRVSGYLDDLGRGRFDNDIVVDRTDELGEMMSALSRTQEHLRGAMREQQSAEEKMRSSERRFRAAFDDAPVGMAMLSLDGQWQRVNDALCGILGYPARHLTRGRSDAVSHAADADGEVALVRQILSGETDSASCEKRFVHKAGHILWVEVTVAAVYEGHDEPSYCLAQFQDVTQRREAEEQLVRLAHFDSLTGLASRTLFLDRLDHALQRARREDEFHGLLFVDLDRFKVVNDSMGHRCGDELLKQIAARLRESVRDGDTVARVGGDEFTVLMEDISDEGEATAVAQRIIEAVREPVRLEHREVKVTASVGIAVSGPAHRSPDDVVHDADVAMYQAKLAGKNRCEVFRAQHRTRSLQRLTLENELHYAIDREQLELHYQPIYATRDTRLAGAEALIRWRHPERGIIPPLEFIGMAEETGFINPLGQWVFRQACEHVRAWQRIAPELAPWASVNVSALQLTDPGFVTGFAETLRESELRPDLLCLELTESAWMSDISRDDVLAALRDLGLRLAVDDFGTGYSSLGRLSELDLDVIKLDRQFVRRAHHSPLDQQIISAVVRLSETAGTVTVAEGVETADQLHELEALGCDLVQGYHLARPMPAAAFMRFLEEQSAASPTAGAADLSLSALTPR